MKTVEAAHLELWRNIAGILLGVCLFISWLNDVIFILMFSWKEKNFFIL